MKIPFVVAWVCRRLTFCTFHSVSEVISDEESPALKAREREPTREFVCACLFLFCLLRLWKTKLVCCILAWAVGPFVMAIRWFCGGCMNFYPRAKPTVLKSCSIDGMATHSYRVAQLRCLDCMIICCSVCYVYVVDNGKH